jgi:hypothetical protein
MKGKTLLFSLTMLIIAGLSSCNEQEKDVSLAKTLNVTTNKEYQLDNGAYLKIVQLNDSRRPIGARSTWKGEAKLKIQLFTGKRRIDTALSTGFPNEVILDGYHLKLNSVFPYPELNKTRHQSDYAIQILAEKSE